MREAEGEEEAGESAAGEEEDAPFSGASLAAALATLPQGRLPPREVLELSPRAYSSLNHLSTTLSKLRTKVTPNTNKRVSYFVLRVLLCQYRNPISIPISIPLPIVFVIPKSSSSYSFHDPYNV
eukprot:7801236-Pyramimonas_sp.AAC.1